MINLKTTSSAVSKTFYLAESIILKNVRIMLFIYTLLIWSVIPTKDELIVGDIRFFDKKFGGSKSTFAAKVLGDFNCAK